MSAIHSHITFNGNCREAMSFYQKCLGGKLSFQTVGDTPAAKRLPAKIKKTILHAQLTSGWFMLMGSDMTEEGGLVKGNSVSLVLNCENEKEIRSWYKKLSQGGRQTHLPEVNYQGVLSGSLTDKYGTHWLLSVKPKK